MKDTDLAGAMADTSRLSDFEGLPVRQVGIEIPGVRIRIAKEKASGIARLNDPDRFAADHAAGRHVELVEGCYACDEEVTAANEEAGGG